MSTRSAAKRQLRATRSSETTRPSSDVRGARTAASAGASGRLGAEKATGKASEKPTRKRPLVDHAEASERKEDGDKEEGKTVKKRRRSLPEEETKGGEDGGEEDEMNDGEQDVKDGEEEGEEEEDEEERAGRKRTRVDLLADLDFVRALAAARDRMDAAPLKMVVWDEVAQGRFRNGRGAKARLEWLQQVRRDRHHVEYAKLTHEMKTLLHAWTEAAAKSKEKAREGLAAPTPGKASPKKRQKIGLTDSSRVRRLRRQAMLADAAAVDVDEKTSQKTSDEASAPPPVVVKPHSRFVFDTDVEESIMELVLEYAPQFATAAKKLDVWAKIAGASNGRYTNANSARNHVGWLLRSLRDPSHRVASEATPRLREMLEKYVVLHAASPVNEAPSDEPAKTVETVPAPPPTDAPAATPAQAEPVASLLEEDKVGEEDPAVDAPADERFVRGVLKKMWAFDDNEDKNAERWQKIVLGVHPPHPKIASGSDAMARLAWLLRVRDDANHTEHAKLSASLHKMLVDYTAAQKTVNQTTVAVGIPSPSTPPPSTPPLPTPPPPTSEPIAREEPEDAEAEAEAEADEPEEETAESEDAADENKKAPSTPQEPKRPKSMQVDLVRDEHLMKLVLELRPFDAERTAKGALWAKVVETLENPKITTGIAAHSRMRWLLNVYQQPSSPDHEHLSDELRSMLEEYDRIHEAARAEELSQALSVRVDVSDEDEDTQAKADPVNDLLVREILRLRPFHAKIGTGMVVWKQVASKVNRAAGAKIYPTGQSCLSQMKKLLAASRSSATKSDIFLTNKQRAMMRLIDALLKVRWPTGKTDLTDDHRACLDKIQRVLTNQPDVKIPPRPKSKPTTPKSSSTKAPASVQFSYASIPPVAGVDPIDALQQDIAKFRETAARDRASRGKSITRVEQQITSCRVQLQAQMNDHDKERREQRDESRTIMELLKSEHEMHARESELLLQVVQKEREDRRHEFVALMDLVTRTTAARRDPPVPTA